MLVERVEGKWIEAFAETFRLCGVTSGEVAAVLWESQSRPVNVQLADLALQRLGARVFNVGLPTPRAEGAGAGALHRRLRRHRRARAGGGRAGGS